MPLRHQDTRIHQESGHQWFKPGAAWSLGDLVAKKILFGADTYLDLITILILTMLSSSETDNKKELIDIATSYVSGQFEEANKTVDVNGIIRIGNRQMGYIIDPSTIIKGMINDDPEEDAIIPVSFYSGPFLQRTEHLFVMKTDDKPGVTKILDTLMKVLEIRDGIIYAEISKVAPDSPSYGCALCKEIVKYRYSNGDIILAD